MLNYKVRHRLQTIALLLLCAALMWVGSSRFRSEDDALYALKMPEFVQTAYAAEAENSGVQTLQNDAGISAYFDSGITITLSDIRGTFRTVEDETSDYIIGSVALPNMPESEDVHVYAHTSGWMMAYHLKEQPASKIIDWNKFHTVSTASVETTLETALGLIAASGGASVSNVTYYDFRNPNATEMLLIAEANGGENNRSFNLNIPTGLVVYERSWAAYEPSSGCCYSNLYLNDVSMFFAGYNTGPSQGLIDASDLPLNTSHEIRLESSLDYGGLVLIYKD